MSSSCHRRTERRSPIGWMRPGVLATSAAVLALMSAGMACAQAADIRPLRICADPDNLPFSNERGQGFENHIARVLARELGAVLSYTWRTERRSFLRTTLQAHECDVAMGLPAGLERVLTTEPYYRSSYVFVAAGGPARRVRSFDDPALRTLRIGLHAIGSEGANTPVAAALADRGITDHLTGFPMWDESTVAHPAARVIDAVANGAIDVAIVWGPFGGYFAKRYAGRLAVAFVSPDQAPSTRAYAFDIVMGVRREDAALRDALNRALTKRRAEIRRILRDFAIPTLPEPT